MLSALTKATRTTRPLIDYPAYFENTYCLDCNSVHMTEITTSGKILCHGESYYLDAIRNRTHYARRLGKGFELVPMSTPAQMPLEWQILAEIKEPEYIDVEQDW